MAPGGPQSAGVRTAKARTLYEAGGSQHTGVSNSFTASAMSQHHQLAGQPAVTNARRHAHHPPPWAIVGSARSAQLPQRHGQHAGCGGGGCNATASGLASARVAVAQPQQLFVCLFAQPQQRQLAAAACSRGSLPARIRRRLEELTRKARAASRPAAPRLDRASATFLHQVAMAVPSRHTALVAEDSAAGSSAGGGAGIAVRVREMHAAAVLAKQDRKAATICR